MTTARTCRPVAVQDPQQFGRVAVMYGGSSDERDVSLASGQAVLAALTARGVNACGWDPAEKSFGELVGGGFSRIWNALHGPGGEDGVLQGALDYVGVPYTGSGVLASALAMDKLRSKKLFAAAGIATPAYRAIRSKKEAHRSLETLGLPVVLKPVHQGSSIGMSKVVDAAALDKGVDLALRFDDLVLVEQCISGSEITVAILQGAALPSIRIDTPRVFYDYRAKYESERTTYVCPGSSEPEQESQYASLALRAFEELGCSGWGRVDFMHADGQSPQVLEVNTVPGMTAHSLVPIAAAAAGIGFEELCWRVLETSFQAETSGEQIGVFAHGA